MEIKFEYGIRDRVMILALNVVGMVVGLFYGESGRQYEVAYFLDGSKERTYLYSEEIGVPDGSELGFI